MAGTAEAGVSTTTDKPETEVSKPKKDCISKLRTILESKHKAALFTHPVPDPDGIGSIMAISWLLSKLNIESRGFYVGSISHPQNIAMVNLLDPDLKPYDEYKQDEYDLKILVDAIPSNAGVIGVNFDVVIDHHKDSPNGFEGLFINVKAGSACATVFHLIQELGLEFEEDVDADARVATALMVGIVTDTEYLMSDDTTEYEFTAWSHLFGYRQPVNLKRIVNYERPKAWIAQEAAAINSVEIVEGVGIVGIGLIPLKHRDMIADLASQMVTWEDVHTAVVFAVIDGERIEGSVRSNNASVMVPQLCKLLGGKHGQGGGKLGKGAYRYELAGVAIEEEDGDEIRQATWELLNKREIARISRIISNS